MPQLLIKQGYQSSSDGKMRKKSLQEQGQFKKDMKAGRPSSVGQFLGPKSQYNKAGELINPTDAQIKEFQKMYKTIILPTKPQIKPSIGKPKWETDPENYYDPNPKIMKMPFDPRQKRELKKLPYLTKPGQPKPKREGAVWRSDGKRVFLP